MTASSRQSDLADFAAEVGSVGLVAVVGSRTRWSLGGEPVAGTRLVAAPGGIVEHRPEEMIVRVCAGTTVRELHEALAERGQRTALPDRGGTVGGAIAVGEDDLEVLGRGRVRDSVLQLRYVDASGRLVSCGGAVVKNVSGFNLPKLMVGSLGTLGLVAEVVLRTNPIPAAGEWLCQEEVDPVAVLDCLYRPAAVLWDGARTWARLEGHAGDVAAERKRLESIARTKVVDGPPELPAHRWSLCPGDVVGLDPGARGRFVASLGVGTVWAERPQPARPADPVARDIAARAKRLFDPSGRLNPGRVAGG